MCILWDKSAVTSNVTAIWSGRDVNSPFIECWSSALVMNIKEHERETKSVVISSYSDRINHQAL